MIKSLMHALEAASARLLLCLFAMLSLDRASALGGRLARAIGPRLAVSHTARRNLGHAFPDKSSGEIEAIIQGMWDNLGRVAAEYAHLGKIDVTDPAGRVDVVGVENVELLRDDQKSGIFFSAHLGNWEIASLGATQNGVPLTQIYRSPNNPLMEPVLQSLRAPVGGRNFPKGSAGAKQLIRAISRGDHLGMLIDQKLNEGIAVPFFGRDAMTAPALAQLALKYGCPVVPARVERLEGAHFRLTVYPPLTLPDSGDRKADVAAVMGQVNAVIEDWIRARPEQWLWLHRRWPE